LEYDPKRNALIALVIYSNGVICYTLNTETNKVGDKIITRKNNFLITGNSTYLYEIPVGTHIHNLEFFEGLGAQIARSAGNYAVIISKSIKNCVVRLKSHQLKILPSRSIGTIGNVSNFRFLYKNFKKAGYYRRKG
jgi:large subunit ribosomal protein L2